MMDREDQSTRLQKSCQNVSTELSKKMMLRRKKESEVKKCDQLPFIINRSGKFLLHLSYIYMIFYMAKPNVMCLIGTCSTLKVVDKYNPDKVTFEVHLWIS